MNIIKPTYMITNPDLDDPKTEMRIYRQIEAAGRTCYKSEQAFDDETAKRFILERIRQGHESILEHASMTVRFVVDRGVSHELVRHRLASFAQESTRYCNYSKGQFGNELTFIKPWFFHKEDKAYDAWIQAMAVAEESYMRMIKYGCPPEQARTVLPNSLKTEVVMTTNMREWRHFLKLRAVGTTGKPHPQMVEVAMPLLSELRLKLPILFEDIRPIEK